METGLNYNGFRDYNPATGRFVESDPIGLTGGINTYGYVFANPLSAIDPLGLAAHVDLLDPSNPSWVIQWADSYTPDGFNTVILHDGSLGFSGDTAGNDPYKTQYVADRLKNKKGYDPDLPTLLIACGAASTIDAQIFSTDLNDQVWASPDPLTPPVENGQPVLGGDPIAFIMADIIGQDGKYFTRNNHPKLNHDKCIPIT